MARTCSVADCTKLAWARGLCPMHLRRFKRYGDPLGGGTFAGEPLKFAETAAQTEEQHCILWPFAKDQYGYGRICNKGVHRLVCEIAHGIAPSGRHEAAHSCGNGHLGCINPHHLRWATHRENHGDRAFHGTNNAGETHGASKLNDEAVREIRSRFAVGEAKASIARSFGVSESNVRKVLSGKSWGHVA